MSNRKLSVKDATHGSSRTVASTVVSVIHIRRDPASHTPWVMRSCVCERRVQSLHQALDAAVCAAGVASKLGRRVLIRLHRSAGRSQTFTVGALQAKARGTALAVAVTSIAQIAV